MVRDRFVGLVGQDTAISLLERAVQQQRIAPAYLFAGPSGVGRRLGAERFAELLLAKSAIDPPSPLLRRRIQQRNHPDVLWVEPTYLSQGKLLTATEAAEQGLKRKSPPQIRLEQIRELTRFLSRPPLESHRAVVIVEGAETMAEAPANGLLKTLEEPGQATIILLAPDTNSLLPTLVSRCQLIPFARLGATDLQQVLTQVGYSEILSTLGVMAMAQGSPGQAIAAYDQLQAIPEGLLSTLLTPPTNLRDALERGRQVAKALDTEAQLWLADYLQHRYWQLDTGNGCRWLPLLEQAKRQLRSYGQPRLVWEVTFMGLLD